jgi:hypothetical protein|tara:strand:- start:129 stop:317 length:189 start_codon:yes stop_codon:yes gene_type:complete
MKKLEEDKDIGLADDPDKEEQIDSSIKQQLSLVKQKTCSELKAGKHGNESDIHISKDRVARN